MTTQLDYFHFKHQIVEFDGMLLDMYRPADVSIPLPAVLVFHDGGWLWGGIGRYERRYQI
jgi:hypothetical protein